MGKGMDICVEYTGRYTSVSGDVLKTTSSKEIEFQIAWKILPQQIWDCASFIHRVHGAIRYQIFTPLKAEQNFILSRRSDAAF